MPTPKFWRWRNQFYRIESTGANPIKIITPTPKFWSWRNYEKNIFQSYKTTFQLKIKQKDGFWH